MENFHKPGTKENTLADIKITEKSDGVSHFLVAEGPTPDDIHKQLTEKLVGKVAAEIDMNVAKWLVDHGWTPPPGHPSLSPDR